MGTVARTRYIRHVQIGTDLKVQELCSSFPPYRGTGIFDVTALTATGVATLVREFPGAPGDWVKVGMKRTLTRKQVRELGWA